MKTKHTQPDLFNKKDTSVYYDAPVKRGRRKSKELVNYVKLWDECPKCGALIKEWKTKEGLLCGEFVSPVTVNTFYNNCPTCGVLIIGETIKELVDVTLRVSDGINVD